MFLEVAPHDRQDVHHARMDDAPSSVDMFSRGFDNHRREWWHFTLRDRPGNAPSHDFDIVSRRR